MIKVYYSLILLYLGGLALYDIKTRRVPDRALILLVLIVLPVPVAAAVFSSTGVSSPTLPILQAMIGALFGFMPLFIAAIVSKNGAGIGGGDIKLAAILGYVLGSAEVTLMLLIAVVAAAVFVLTKKLLLTRKAAVLSIPFVPFMFAGSLFIVICKFF